MDMADEVNVGRQVRQDALAAVGAVAGDEDFVLGKPTGDQGNELDGQFGAGAMVRVPFRFAGFGLVLFSLGKALAVAIQAHGQG